MTPTVSVVIPSYRGAALLERFLPAVLREVEALGDAVETLVVDDGGGDDTEALLRRRFAAVTYVGRPVNGGFGQACATGFEAAQGRWVFLLNNDMEPRPGCLPRLLEVAEGRERVFAVSPRVIHPEEGGRDLGTPGLRQRDGWLAMPFGVAPARREPLPILYASGGAALYRRDRVLALGGFDPLYEPYYFEDLDLSYAAWKRGDEVLLVPEAEAHHLGAATIGSLRTRGHIARVQARNKLLFHWKNLTDPGPRRAHWRRLVPRLLRSLLPGRPPYWAGALLALPRMAEACRAAEVERRAAVRGDEELAEELTARQREAGVRWHG